jgi:DNA polymerase III subunit chi
MAPRVDFYVLTSSAERARLLYACRLVEKVYLLEQRVYVHTGSAAEAATFDDLLWTFADRSFVPHCLAPNVAAAAPVTVGFESPAPADLLVNLGVAAPDFCDGYPRVAEVVDADPGRREAGRRRFAWYRDRGLRPETHNVPA